MDGKTYPRLDQQIRSTDGEMCPWSDQQLSTPHFIELNCYQSWTCLLCYKKNKTKLPLKGEWCSLYCAISIARYCTVLYQTALHCTCTELHCVVRITLECVWTAICWSASPGCEESTDPDLLRRDSSTLPLEWRDLLCCSRSIKSWNRPVIFCTLVLTSLALLLCFIISVNS